MKIETRQEAVNLLKASLNISDKNLNQLKAAVIWMMNIEGWSSETAQIDFANYCLENSNSIWRDEYRANNVDPARLNRYTKSITDESRVAAFLDLAIPDIISDFIQKKEAN